MFGPQVVFKEVEGPSLVPPLSRRQEPYRKSVIISSCSFMLIQDFLVFLS